MVIEVKERAMDHQGFSVSECLSEYAFDRMR